MSRFFRLRWRIESEKHNSVILPNMKQIALSEWLQESRVDLLKMNIEGAERLALSGMGEMVQKTRNVCISCHDFLANGGGPNEMRTKADVIDFLKQNGFLVSLRESDGRCNVRDYVYGQNEKLATSARS